MGLKYPPKYTTLDPLNLYGKASVSGGTKCHNVFPTVNGGASGYAGLNTLTGLSQATADAANATSVVTCTGPEVGYVTVTIPVNATIICECVYGYTLGTYVPFVDCLQGDYSINIGTTATADVVLTIPFKTTLNTTSVALSLADCTLKVQNVRNLSVVDQLESDCRDVLDGLTLGLTLFNGIWNDTFAPLFNDLRSTIDKTINNDVLTIIPTNVIANAASSVLSSSFLPLVLPFTGDLCPAALHSVSVSRVKRGDVFMTSPPRVKSGSSQIDAPSSSGCCCGCKCSQAAQRVSLPKRYVRKMYSTAQ